MSLEGKSFEEMETRGVPPSPRGYHGMVALRRPLLVVFGGSNSEQHKEGQLFNDLFVLNYEEKYWTEVCFGGVVPVGRCLFGMAFSAMDR